MSKAVKKPAKPAPSEVAAARTNRNAEAVAEAEEKNAPAVVAREEQAKAQEDSVQADREAVLAKHAVPVEDKSEKPSVTLHDGKPGSGAGLRPGDWHAPASNPGAAARVPSQPLQPESMQSHGFGILHDKDLANPPYDTGDPRETDASPSGSRNIDKEAEVSKQERATGRFRQMDIDNPTVPGDGRRGDATASPLPIGTRQNRRDIAGGSNSGSTGA